MTSPLRILIVGAGIGDLALSRALRLQGFVAEIVERSTEWDRAGTGLFIPANGETRRVRRVRWVQDQTHRRDRTRGLPPALRNCVLPWAGTRIFKANNRPLIQEP